MTNKQLPRVNCLKHKDEGKVGTVRFASNNQCPCPPLLHSAVPHLFCGQLHIRGILSQSGNSLAISKRHLTNAAQSWYTTCRAVSEPVLFTLNKLYTTNTLQIKQTLASL